MLRAVERATPKAKANETERASGEMMILAIHSLGVYNTRIHHIRPDIHQGCFQMTTEPFFVTKITKEATW